MHTILYTLRHWKTGIRLYIALATIAVTVESWWWARANFGSGNLFSSRLEELYAWLALALIAIAVCIGPFYKLLPRVPGKRQWFEARRLIGISGAWFASLHVLLAYDALFNFVNPRSLPVLYQQSFALGALALIILLAMAGTSFDAAQRWLGPWWYRLHRLVYVALIAVLAHIMLVGVHATNTSVLTALVIVASIILLAHILVLKQRPTWLRAVTLLLLGGALLVVFNYGYNHTRGIDAGETNETR